MAKSPRSLTIGLSAFFFTIGCGSASWMVRLPEVRVALDLSVASLGIVLFIGAVGALSALLLSSFVIEKMGAKRAVVIGFSTIVVGQVITALGLMIDNLILFTVGGFIAGFGFGLGDVGINLEGTELEKMANKSRMPMLHGMYSAGTLTGALLGALLITFNFALPLQCLAFGAVLSVVTFFGLKVLPSTTGIRKRLATPVITSEMTLTSRRNWRVLLLGVGILCISLAEGGANDWLAITLVQDYGTLPETAALVFAAMTTGMLIARFSGDMLIDRFGRAAVLRVFVSLGTLGVLFVALNISVAIAVMGSLLWGVGVALGFPVFISSAADGNRSSRDVARVTAFGYSAFLVGPPVLGFIANATSLIAMLYLLAGLLTIVIFVAGATRPPVGTVTSE